MSKTIHIHVGVLSGCRALVASDLEGTGLTLADAMQVDEVAQAFAQDDVERAQQAIARLSQEADRAPGDLLVSNDTLVGVSPGLLAKRRIYPRLARNLRLLARAFKGHDFRIYVARPAPDAFLRLAYREHLIHRPRFSSFEAFASFLETDALWDRALDKPRSELDNRLVELEGSGGGFDVLTHITGQVCTAHKAETLTEHVHGLFETVNGSSASSYAKQNAKRFLLDPPTEQSAVGMACTWPPALKRPDWLAPGLNSLWERAERRVRHQDQPDLLPASDADLAVYRTQIVEADEDFPQGGRGAMDNQLRILAYRFRGMPETCVLLGLAISYLRRSTEHTDRASDLFQRLWAQEYPLLLGMLPTRWLISAFQTFMDHGVSEAQRKTGAAAFFLANTLKLYEAERAIEGQAPDATYPSAKPQTRMGFRGLDRFDVGGSDLMVNTTALLLELAAQDDVSGRVVQEFLLRLKHANSAFSRMDKSRISLEINNPQFKNCWSFADAPK